MIKGDVSVIGVVVVVGSVEEDDDWKKLGQTRPPKVSSNVAAAVLPKVRLTKKRRTPIHTGHTGNRANCSMRATFRRDCLLVVLISSTRVRDAAGVLLLLSSCSSWIVAYSGDKTVCHPNGVLRGGCRRLHGAVDVGPNIVEEEWKEKA